MNPNEALEWAADYAARHKLFEAPLKANGYAKDNWKDPTPAEKAEIIKDLANQVITGEMIPKSLARTYLISAIGSVDDVSVLGPAMKNLDSLFEKGDY